MSFDRFGKELHLISVSLGGFCVKSQSQIIALAFWFEEVFDFTPRLSVSLVSKLMSLQNFSQLVCDSILRLSLISFCNCTYVSLPKGDVPESQPTFLLD